MKFGIRFHLEEAMRYADMRLACERAARIAAPFAAPDEVERYITACDEAKRRERRNNRLIDIMNVVWPWPFVLFIRGGYGLIACAVFMALWALFGIHQLCVHKARLHAEAVVLASARLVESVTNKAK
jgi:hypothetical protein